MGSIREAGIEKYLKSKTRHHGGMKMFGVTFVVRISLRSGNGASGNGAAERRNGGVEELGAVEAGWYWCGRFFFFF